MSIGPVHWESYPGELVEEVMAVLLLQERPTSYHRRPSKGDGGVDVCEPTSDGYHVYQVKRYSKSLSAKNKKDIAESFHEVQRNPRLNRRVSAWSLVIPLDPTSGDIEWFNKLTLDAEFPVEWLGRSFWHSESSKYPYVIDYFLENGKELLMRRVHTLAELLRNPTDTVRPADVVSALSELDRELNSSDPYYSYDLKVTSVKSSENPQAIFTACIAVDDGRFVTVETLARFPQAVSDSPIEGRFTFTIFDEESDVDLRDAFQAHQDFGRGFQIPPNAIATATINVPGGFGTNESAIYEIQIGAPALRPDSPMWADLEVVAADGLTTVAEAVLPVISLSAGQVGFEIQAGDPSGYLNVQIQTVFPVKSNASSGIDLQVNGLQGAAIASAGPAYRFAANLRPPNRLNVRLRSSFQVLSRGELLLDEAAYPDWESGLRHLDMLIELQAHTITPLVFPLSDSEWFDVLHAVELLRGETFTREDHWSSSAECAADDIGRLRFDYENGDVAQVGPLIVVNGTNKLALGVMRIKLVGARFIRAEELKEGRIRAHFEGDSLIESGAPLPQTDTNLNGTREDPQEPNH